jgi:hypothetical protein
MRAHHFHRGLMSITGLQKDTLDLAHCFAIFAVSGRFTA